MRSATHPPGTDPTPIFEAFRGSYATELLTAAVAHFNVFGLLGDRSMSETELRDALQLVDRPFVVLLTALKALGLIRADGSGQLSLTPLAAEHLVPGAEFDVGDYVGLAAQTPGVLAMVERLRTNRPAGHGDDAGVAFIYRDGLKSAMDQSASARHFTLALAGRARNVAPVLAARVPIPEGILLDVGGGTGIYSIACLQANPGLRAVVFDRPEVLRVAEEFAAESGVAERLACVPGDMFADPLPDADTVLLSNVLHDWDVPACRRLLRRCAEAIPPGGRVLIHDVFLNDALDGPLPVAFYSAALFSLTETSMTSGIILSSSTCQSSGTPGRGGSRRWRSGTRGSWRHARPASRSTPSPAALA